MTLAQYKAITADVTDFNKEIDYIFTSENTKIQTDRYPKIELDEGNELIKAYSYHPKSTDKEKIYILSFVCTLDSVFAIHFKIQDGVETIDKDGNKVFTPSLQNQLESIYGIGNYN